MLGGEGRGGDVLILDHRPVGILSLLRDRMRGGGMQQSLTIIRLFYWETGSRRRSAQIATLAKVFGGHCGPVLSLV